MEKQSILTPSILEDIVIFLKEYNITISENVEGEGRGGSLKDEGTIKKALMESDKFKDNIIDEKARSFGDIIVLDYDGVTRHPVNIKTSIGSSDNSFSKGGTVFAFTNLHDTMIPKSMNFDKMNTLIKNNNIDVPSTKDYWYLCINKKDPSKVIVRGMKQINNWVININPSNVLQINWNKEKNTDPKIQSYEEAYNNILGGVKKSLNSFWNNIPDEWKETKDNVILEP